MAADLHPDLAVLAPLLGTWQGQGSGEYPTIESFEYLESITFGHVGKPFLSYQQKTRDAGTGSPMHAEAGYWRTPGSGRLEIVMAQPTGFAEVYEGTIATVDGIVVMDVKSTSIGATTTAKDVSITERTFELDGDELRYTFRMAAVGQPLQHHLSATLKRSALDA
ncbi:MAG: fatty acid-binding-like protein [Actinobacteria bacterium]|nr:MAG: fatty acid-binding-like protein [Actinomycetota bacterium]